MINGRTVLFYDEGGGGCGWFGGGGEEGDNHDSIRDALVGLFGGTACHVPFAGFAEFIGVVEGLECEPFGRSYGGFGVDFGKGLVLVLVIGHVVVFMFWLLFEADAAVSHSSLGRTQFWTSSRSSIETMSKMWEEEKGTRI